MVITDGQQPPSLDVSVYLTLSLESLIFSPLFYVLFISANRILFPSPLQQCAMFLKIYDLEKEE